MIQEVKIESEFSGQLVIWGENIPPFTPHLRCIMFVLFSCLPHVILLVERQVVSYFCYEELLRTLGTALDPLLEHPCCVTINLTWKQPRTGFPDQACQANWLSLADHSLSCYNLTGKLFKIWKREKSVNVRYIIW